MTKKTVYLAFLYSISISTSYALDSNTTLDVNNNANTVSNSASYSEARSNGVIATNNSSAAGRDNVNVAASNLSSMIPNVQVPNLTTTLTETCMGSSSAGASGAGFGFSFGTTWSDKSCVRRLDARQMTAFGDIATARQMMCQSDAVREAAKLVGRPCIEDGGTPFGVANATPIQQTLPSEAAATQTTHQ